MFYDFMHLMPKARLAGIDVCAYAIALDPMRPFVRVGNAKSLPYADAGFDLVLAINTIHNLPYEDCKKSLREIQRVFASNSGKPCCIGFLLPKLC
jgi:ubiquinone/menaquinone biosynthesis C-methylase UbiE